MASTSSVNSSFDYSTLNTRSNTTKSAIEQQQDRFLKLLVKQLQSQDPMNPMDSAQSTSQMAQINTVTGIEKLNQTMSTMMSLYAGTQVMQAAGLIGKEVLAPGSQFAFDGKSAELRYDVPKDVSSAEVKVYNDKGALVATLPYANLKPGLQTLAWDGKQADGSQLPAGNYRMSVRGVDGNGKEVALDSYTWQGVKSVEFGAAGVTALMDNGNKASFGDIVQIRAGNGSVA